MSQRPPEDHFADAARRHHADAVYLHDDGRKPNADQLYGFAVECALKSILLRFNYASMNTRNRPQLHGPGSQSKEIGHLPKLWDVIAPYLHGRSSGRLARLLTGENPFKDWTVNERYRDGASITDSIAVKHRNVSMHVLRIHDEAIITGVLQ